MTTLSKSIFSFGLFLSYTLIGSLAAAASAPLTPAEIRQRLELRTDIYTLDASGKRVLDGPNRESVYRMDPETGKLNGNWGSQFNKNQAYLRYSFEVLDDGTIKVYLEEFKNGDGNFSESIEKKEFIMQNFEPIVWKSKRSNPDNFVIRMIPKLREMPKAVSMEGIPLSASNATISDSEGYLWADEVDFAGKYCGFKTHRGALVLSYVPFKGAKELGTAEGKSIVLKPTKNLTIKINSETDLLPHGVTAKVYGTYDASQKSKRVNSVHTWDSNSEERILQGFRN